MANSRNIVALSILSLALSWGCVSSPVIAPSDGNIFLSANPAAIVLDEFAVPAVTAADIVISAQILSMDGVPQSGVSVVFTADSGALASAPAGQAATPLETDDNGFVSDTLTLQLGDPAMTTVTARSGSLVETVEIGKTEIGANQAPLAIIDIIPAGSALLNATVVYDATGSVDPDGDAITCYQWQIETSKDIPVPPGPLVDCLPSNSRCEVVQGPNSSIATADYGEEQQVVVFLRITDDPSIVCPPGGPAEPLAAFNGLAVDTHDVVCDRFLPNARIVATHTVQGPPPFDLSQAGGSITVTLDGSTSGGGDSGIVSWEWTCPLSTTTTPADGELSSCAYDTAGDKTVTLKVTNGCTKTDTITFPFQINP